MVLAFGEEKELLEMKHTNQAVVLKAQEHMAAAEHIRKIKRLDKLLEIAKAGGIGFIEK